MKPGDRFSHYKSGDIYRVVSLFGKPYYAYRWMTLSKRL